MDSAGSVTHWLGQLKAGEQAAAQPLWERYFRRLVGLANKKLHDGPRRAADEEDIALSAFHSFCQCAQAERFPKLDDRDDLWQVLMMLVARKALNWKAHEGREKRGGKLHADADLDALSQIVGHEPTPAFAAQIADEYRRLMELLPKPELRQIAQWKMEGDTNEEIAAKMPCALRTVERRFELIRSLWDEEQN